MALLVLSWPVSLFADSLFEGRFCGPLASSGRLVSVSTNINQTSNGEWVGDYEFIEFNKIVHGTLSHGRLLDGDTMLLSWADRFGVGRLAITFLDKGNAFSGLWGIKDEKPIYLWNGRRCGFDLDSNSTS